MMEMMEIKLLVRHPIFMDNIPAKFSHRIVFLGNHINLLYSRDIRWTLRSTVFTRMRIYHCGNIVLHFTGCVSISMVGNFTSFSYWSRDGRSSLKSSSFVLSYHKENSIFLNDYRERFFHLYKHLSQIGHHQTKEESFCLFWLLVE